MSAINVLVVDDSQTVRNVIIKTLGLADVETNNIYEAANGEEGLACLKDNWVDLIFSDINMPVMNGLEMIEALKEDDLLKTLPIIVVTTEGSKSRIARFDELGVNAYIRKPFSPERLNEVVHDVLGGLPA